MRILRVLASALVFLIGIFFIGGMFIPSEWKVSRSISTHASRDQIYSYINNFKEWEKWSPWNTAKDSTLHYTYTGPEDGVGAKQSWTSEKMGKGWMELTSADPQAGISYELFIDMGNSQSTLQGNIAFTTEENVTIITWTDKGVSGTNYLKRWMSLLIKPMLAKDINLGLANLKSLVEKT